MLLPQLIWELTQTANPFPSFLGRQSSFCTCENPQNMVNLWAPTGSVQQNLLLPLAVHMGCILALIHALSQTWHYSCTSARWQQQGGPFREHTCCNATGPGMLNCRGRCPCKVSNNCMRSFQCLSIFMNKYSEGMYFLNEPSQMVFEVCSWGRKARIFLNKLFHSWDIADYLTE